MNYFFRFLDEVYAKDFLDVDYDADTWADHDERCHCPYDTEENRRICPEGFIWGCCEEDGRSKGCKWSRHWAHDDERAKKLRELDDDNKDNEDDDDDDDDNAPAVHLKHANMPNDGNIKCVQCGETYLKSHNTDKSCWYHTGKSAKSKEFAGLPS